MSITNLKGYPQALVDAVKNDGYSKGNANFSVTELLKPPQQRQLEIRHHDLIEEDVEDRLWALYGQVAHVILERANRLDLSEKRFFMKVGDQTISGQIDTLCIEDEILTDYKFTTSWGFMANQPPKPEWIAQLNMQLELLRQNGYDARHLQIVGLLRDHQKSKAKEEPNYPRSPIAKHDIPMWPRPVTYAYMKKRVELHLLAEKRQMDCTDEDRWAKPDLWAVMKPGQKRASKLCQSPGEAQDMAQAIGAKVVLRKGKSARCEDYCKVNQFCIQYQSELRNKEVVNGAKTTATTNSQSALVSSLSED